MLRALAFVSVLALTAGAAMAQPPGDPNGYGAQPQGQQPYPPADQGYPQASPGGGAGYGAQGYGQGSSGAGYGGRGGGGGRWAADPQMRALRHQMREACATDLSTYCGGASQGGHGAMHQCMMANQAKFSPPCQQAIGSMMSYMHQMRGQDGGPGGGDTPPPGGPQPQ